MDPIHRRPEILILSLVYQSFFDEIYASLLDHLRRSVQVKRAKTASGAIRYLTITNNNPKAILVADEGLTDAKNSTVLDQVVLYARNGGLVIIGLHFPCFTQYDHFDRFFEGLGLPWQVGAYSRTTFQLNPACSLPPGVVASSNNSFPAPYSMKALYVKNAEPHEKIFVPVPDEEEEEEEEEGEEGEEKKKKEEKTQPDVFSPDYLDRTLAAVVGARMGDGFVVYIGDVNGEKGSDEVILRLCGL